MRTLSAVATLLLVAQASVARAERERLGPDPDPAAVVTTWEALAKRPLLRVSEKVTVRVGLEANRVRSGSGVLLYLLVEGPDESRIRSDLERVGPVSVEVRRPGLRRIKEKAVFEQLKTLVALGPRLYLKAIPTPSAGQYVVRIKTPGGDVLKELTIEARAERAHGWLPFGPPKEERLEELRHIGQPAEAFVSAFVGGPAIPRWEPQATFPKPEATKSATEPANAGSGEPRAVKETPLPKLFPAKPDRGLTLMLRGETFQVRSDVPISVDDPQRKFLARWWVNGKPFHPERRLQRAEEISRQASEPEKRLDLHVAFDPEPFGAKPGDRIAVQLLYCEDGWEWLDDRERLMREQEQRRQRPAVSRASNKVEFVVQP